MLILLSKQFWLEEPADLRIDAENVSQCIIGISHFITWLHGVWLPCSKVLETCSWSCALPVATEYVTCHLGQDCLTDTCTDEVYLALHVSPRDVLWKAKRLNFWWQMYLARWSTPVIAVAFFFPPCCCALLYCMALLSLVPQVRCWGITVFGSRGFLFFFSNDMYLDLIYFSSFWWCAYRCNA